MDPWHDVKAIDEAIRQKLADAYRRGAIDALEKALEQQEVLFGNRLVPVGWVRYLLSGYRQKKYLRPIE